MKKLIIALGLGLALASPAYAQFGVQTWGYSTAPSWGGGYAPQYGAPFTPAPQYGCRFIPNPWERERCRQHRDWQRGW